MVTIVPSVSNAYATSVVRPATTLKGAGVANATNGRRCGHGLPSSYCLIENGRFDGASAPWQGNLTPPASGSVEVQSGVKGRGTGGALCLTIDRPGQFAWDAALSYAGLQLERGKRYTIDFRAWASAPTLVRTTQAMAQSPYREHWVRYFELLTQPRQWRNSIVMSNPFDGKHQLAFRGGGPAARTLPVTLCIDDVQVSAW